MNEPLWIRTYRLLFGLLAIVAVVAKYLHDGDSFGNWISKFTILGNAFAGAVLIAGAVLGREMLTSGTWDRIRGASVMYLVMTFVVYGVLINGFDNPVTSDRHWTHTVLHQLIPVVVVLDAMIRPFVHQLDWRVPFQWTVFPLLYLAYSLARGAVVDWYPYDFIDPDEVGGYDGVALYCIGITVAFLAVAWIIVALARLSYRARLQRPAGSVV